MAASYPAGFDTMSDPAANLSGPPLHSTMHNQINDVVEAIEAELGLTPSGADATVAASIAAVRTLGYVTKTTSTATTAGIVAATDVCSVTFTAVAGRRYRLSAIVQVTCAGAQADVFTVITTAANAQLQLCVRTIPANKSDTFTSFYDVVPGAGSVTYKVRISPTASVTLNGGATQMHVLMVEDIGV